jgi:hypothetical protein
MALTAQEEERLQQVEEYVVKLFKLLDGAGSRNRLNRWYVLLSNMNNTLSEKVTEIETELDEILALARKLQ